MGASDKIAAKLSDLEREASSLESEIAELERGTPTIEPDMVRYLLSRIRNCDGPDAVVRGFVKRVIVDGDDVRVFFTVGGSRPPGKEPADGDYELDGLGKSHDGAPSTILRARKTSVFSGLFSLACCGAASYPAAPTVASRRRCDDLSGIGTNIALCIIIGKVYPLF